MAKVLRAIDERRRREEAGPAAAAPRPRRSPTRYVAIAMVAAIALSVGLVPSLLRSLHDRTGDDLTISLATFQARVRHNPHDVAARLDLGHYYLDHLGQFGDAFKQFTAALAIQPDNVDALASYGLLIYLSGRPLRGLHAEEKALSIDPTYGDALFYKGTILLKGLDQPRQAIAALQAYLGGNPTGSYGDSARREIAAAKAQLGDATPTPGAPTSGSP
jgi:cytochrome c-type biogenesis protein CcmH/NrfG